MGYYKRLADNKTELRRYQATQRRADKMSGLPTSRLIRLETVSDIERFSMAQDADRLTEFNKAVETWQDNVTAQLKAYVSVRSTRIAQELKPTAYTDKYGIINRIGYAFPRHGIYLHKGAGRGYGGFYGSKWHYLKTVNGVQINTGILRHTNPQSLGQQDSGGRDAYKWFDPIVRNKLPELADIVMKYFDNMIIDATRIFIEK